MSVDLAERLVLVLGLGESGLAMTRWCLREGARVRVADTRDVPPKRDAVPSLGDVDVRLGAFADDLLDGVDLIAISPGLAPRSAPQAALLASARTRGIALVGEIELFAWKLAAMKLADGHAPRVVAITGTNGKTTVTRLVGRMAEASGRQVVVAGNVSPAALDALSDALDAHARGRSLPDTWVLELSSFQLETTTSLVADVATVLNVTQDHLDWHGDLASYVRAKASIFAPSTVRVLNRDDARAIAMDADGVPSVRFGLDAPVAAGDFGLVRDAHDVDGLRWLALAEGGDPGSEARGSVKSPGKRRVAKVAAGEPVRVKRLMPADALHLRGDHNVANVLAALALGRAIGLPMAAMLRAATAYRGEPHRVAFVLERDGVDWIEDSKGTNVGATVAALQGLGRKVVLIGRDRDAIRDALTTTGVPLVDCTTLEAAVDEAARRAETGDAVLLSPACASLDMFRDYEERAEVFVAAVRRLPVLEHATC